MMTPVLALLAGLGLGAFYALGLKATLRWWLAGLYWRAGLMAVLRLAVVGAAAWAAVLLGGAESLLALVAGFTVARFVLVRRAAS